MEHQVNWGSAFKQGLERHGWTVRFTQTFLRCDLYVQWGVRRLQNIGKAKSSGAKVCIIERGYLGDRFQWSSISFGGGLNGRGEFRGPFEDASRFETHFAHLLQPWREDRNDGVALIMGQVPGDTAVANVDLPSFYEKARIKFEALGLRTAFRPHPNLSRTNPAPLHEDLKAARCVVTWNSNSAVDAVMAGVPAVAVDQGSMAWPVTAHELVLPRPVAREPWARALAWKQFTKQEMASGFAAEAVGLASPH